jgi:predicted flap endonuclease-1-like 5' DNA nuclease
MPQIVAWILVSLVVGFLGGWLLEFYLDIKYLEVRARERGFTLAEEVSGPTDKAVPIGDEDPEAASDTNEQRTALLREMQERHKAELNTMRRALRMQNARYEDLEKQFEEFIATHPDDLTAIRGIGREYQWKLRDAGITTYERLANTTPRRLLEILEADSWRKLDPEAWIEQARVLAQRGN